MIRKIFQLLHRLYAIRTNVSFKPDLHIGLGTIISASEKLDIGENVYIGKLCTIQVNGRIGKGVLIANNVGLVGRLDHDFRQIGMPVRSADWIGSSKSLSENKRNWLTIEDDVWIGFGAIVLSGVTVRRGTIVAAGSVVRYDTAPYDIVSGNPAQSVGCRFQSEAEISEHESMVREFYNGTRRGC